MYYTIRCTVGNSAVYLENMGMPFMFCWVQKEELAPIRLFTSLDKAKEQLKCEIKSGSIPNKAKFTILTFDKQCRPVSECGYRPKIPKCIIKGDYVRSKLGGKLLSEILDKALLENDSQTLTNIVYHSIGNKSVLGQVRAYLGVAIYQFIQSQPMIGSKFYEVGGELVGVQALWNLRSLIRKAELMEVDVEDLKDEDVEEYCLLFDKKYNDVLHDTYIIWVDLFGDDMYNIKQEINEYIRNC